MSIKTDRSYCALRTPARLKGDSSNRCNRVLGAQIRMLELEYFHPAIL